MTTRAILLQTPFVDLATFGSTLTARASHAQALALLATDAAAGHPRQRAHIDRTVGGTYHVMLKRRARYLLVRAAIALKSSFSSVDNIDIDLAIGDGTTTITSSDARIPVGLKADTNALAPPATATERLDAPAVLAWVLDLADFETGSPSLSGDDRLLSFVVSASGSNIYCEHLTVEELPRWLIDEADVGVIPELFLPRGTIIDGATGLERLWDTARQGYTRALRTYHQLVRDEADPWTIVSGSSTAWTGDQESAGVARKYSARARTMRDTTDPRISFRVRYRATGASPGDVATVVLVTGAGSYSLSLTDTSGSWVEAETQGYLDAATPEQQLSWKGSRTGSGTWEICSRTVFDDPA